MFQTGQKIGPYILDRALGEGSFGVVWLAEERTGLIQRQVALKLPKDADPDIEAIRREAEVWLRAGKHHNVVQVLHADIYDGQVAIATEYIAGGSLHDRLRSEPAKTAHLEFAVEMTRGILAGLQHLHSLSPRPLVHRDLKPGNVLLRGDTPLLTDFGLSRAFSSTTFTQAGGTPGYMPPEAFDDRFSPQTDIWAAGVTLYRVLKGELPFPHRDLSALIGAILNKEPEPLPASVPSAVAAVIFQALMKDPDRRFASADEMRSALGDALLSSTHVMAAPITRLGPIPPLPNDLALSVFDITATGVEPDLGPAALPVPARPLEERLPIQTPVQPGAMPPQVPALAIQERRSRHDAVQIGAEPQFAGMAVEERRTTQAPFYAGATTPQVPAMATHARRGGSYSENLTAVPEPPQAQGLSGRVDGLLRYLSRDTARFCGALIATAPLWGVLAGIGRFLVQSQIVGAFPALFLTSGLMSVLFARIAWHRYYWLPYATRRNTAIRYAVLGLFSATVVPVIAVTLFVAISEATSAPSGAPDLEASRRKIEPPSP